MQSFIKQLEDEDALPLDNEKMLYRSVAKRARLLVGLLPWYADNTTTTQLPPLNLHAMRVSLAQKNNPWKAYFSQHGLNAVYHNQRLFTTVRSAPSPRLIAQARILDSSKAKINVSTAMRESQPTELILQHVYGDRVSAEIYTTVEKVPTVLFMVLGRVYGNLKAGFELGWKGKSTSNAGFTLNYRYSFAEDANIDATLRQTYLGQTDLAFVNQINKRLLTAGNFTFNSTNNTSNYGIAAVYNVLDESEAQKDSTLKSATIGVRWLADRGWGIRWNGDFGRNGSGGLSVGAADISPEGIREMKLGFHYAVEI